MAATFRLVALSLFLCWAAAPPAARAQEPASTLIRNARVIDGLGAAGVVADVRIRAGRIAAVGTLPAEAGERVVDAAGLALAPGFIDTHSHHDRGLDEARDALAAVSQGITTIVVGQDGGGADIAALFAGLDARPAAVNVASYAGHGEVRARVMGDDFKRHATPAEIARMQEMLAREMAAGALGLSTGLEYDPGIYSSPEEVRALANVAAAAGGRYISHMRSEDRDFWQALDELIAIGRETGMPVQVSHMKLAMRSLWGQSEKLIAALDAARASGVNVTADIYPYTYWQSNLGVLYPKRNFDDAAETAFVLEHVAGADDIIFNSFPAHRDYEGKTLADVAALRRTTPAATLMALLAEPRGPNAGIVARGMSDADVERLMQWPHANICSDGVSRGLHPRGFGSFPKVLGPYVREKRLFSLEEAVRKMTSLAAANVGIADRGRIAPGYAADLVLFEPAAVADRADFGRAQAIATGIHTVWVNGEIVFEDGKTTGALPGRPVRRLPEPAARTGVCKATTEQEIAALFDRWNVALQTGDPRAVVDLYAPRSVLLATLANTPLLTPADKAGYFTHFMENRPAGRIDTRTIEIDCNTAWAAGTYTFTFGTTGASVAARYTYTYRWDGTRWLITSHHSSAMPEKH